MSLRATHSRSRFSSRLGNPDLLLVASISLFSSYPAPTEDYIAKKSSSSSISFWLISSRNTRKPLSVSRGDLLRDIKSRLSSSPLWNTHVHLVHFPFPLRTIFKHYYFMKNPPARFTNLRHSPFLFSEISKTTGILLVPART